MDHEATHGSLESRKKNHNVDSDLKLRRTYMSLFGDLMNKDDDNKLSASEPHGWIAATLRRRPRTATTYEATPRSQAEASATIGGSRHRSIRSETAGAAHGQEERGKGRARAQGATRGVLVLVQVRCEARRTEQGRWRRRCLRVGGAGRDDGGLDKIGLETWS
jgi:hypothetical protein